MLKELLSVLRGTHPLEVASEGFDRMLNLTQEMLVESNRLFWEDHKTPEERAPLRKKDILVNELERSIRKEVIGHLTTTEVAAEVPYSLLLISLVKDLERLGDYSKNLAEVPELGKGGLPDNEIVAELKAVADDVSVLIDSAPRVFRASDEAEAAKLTTKGQKISKRCDALLPQVANSALAVDVAVRVTLAARFYKRMAGHLMNLLSGVLMPLHKLDYFDEDVLPDDAREALRKRRPSVF